MALGNVRLLVRCRWAGEELKVQDPKTAPDPPGHQTMWVPLAPTVPRTWRSRRARAPSFNASLTHQPHGAPLAHILRPCGGEARTLVLRTRFFLKKN